MKAIRQCARCAALFSAGIVVFALSAHAGDTKQPIAESDLLAVLRSEAPKADKAIACKQLAIYGSNEAVPYLAGLLTDPQLASWARIALEAIPGPAADEALRAAIDSLDGNLLIGTVNSIGVRRDAGAVEPLTALLKNDDAEVAASAAVALGHIGNAAATQNLQQMLTTAPDAVRSAIAEGCVLCAERLLAEGNGKQAAELYDAVRKSDVPQQRILEGTRGAILARGQEGIPLLIEQFQSPEIAMFQLALTTAREFPGGEVDKALVSELNRAAPERAALIVQAMADRPETVVLAAVLKAAQEGPKPVRLSAIDALARVGNDSCFAPLLKMAVESDQEVADQSKNTLAVLPGETVDSQILALVPKADGKPYPVLLELVGRRRLEAVSDLFKALDHSDPEVRNAALIALGETVSLDRLPGLMARVVSPTHSEDVPVAQKALLAASVRMPDREACAAVLEKGIAQSSSASTKCSLLEILGAMGGPKALEVVAAAAVSPEDELQDVSSRLLGEWMTEDAAPVLLELSSTAPSGKYQVRALRGYIRIARQFDLKDQQRIEMCRKAYDAAQQSAEQKLVLEVLKRYPSMETLKMALQAMEVPAIKKEADQTVLSIAQRMGSMSRRANPFYLPPRPREEVMAERDEAKELISQADFKKVELEIVKAEYGNGTTQKDVTAEVQKHASDSPVIDLGTPTYLACFGSESLPEDGDRQLKIKYVMNGKTGETTFLDDALIILLQP